MPSSIAPDEQYRYHRVSVERRRALAPSLAPLSSLNNDGLLLRNFSYRRLPPQLLRLSVLKLDGCIFDVNVARNATVAELKQAIEEVFSFSPKEGQGKISWSHVWGHFCLCFEHQKLINDKSSIRDFGIKDGDQLEFIRHMSITHDPTKKRSRNSGCCLQTLTAFYNRLSTESNDHEEEEQISDHDEQEDIFQNYHYEDEEEIPMPEFKLAHFLRGWLSYSKLSGVTRKGSEGRSRPSRFALHCFRRLNQDDTGFEDN
ncbi:hypothetical protein L1049_004577 [Liquidambar formosana]|uniref:SNRNP25 ubiquitin-like domain-containing protein n=1 Tax=Liquidambar formosana TaxID=63359 RepID=A0AAP0RP90_LIQFO